jgi:HAD superfamily hydrolase (TIGR01509 family)
MAAMGSFQTFTMQNINVGPADQAAADRIIPRCELGTLPLFSETSILKRHKRKRPKQMAASAVIFDMDGLLLDTESICLATFVETRRQYGLPDQPEVFIRCIGLRGAEPARLVADSLPNAVSFELFSADWGARIKQRLDQDIPLKPGALTLLQLLFRQGRRVGVATSTQTETARNHLKKTGLLPYIQHVVGGDQVPRSKPDPAIYHLAARHLGVGAEDCVAFEDSDNGTRAAVASGATTVQVPDLVPPGDEVRALGHLVATNLLEGAVATGLIQRQHLISMQVSA